VAFGLVARFVPSFFVPSFCERERMSVARAAARALAAAGSRTSKRELRGIEELLESFRVDGGRNMLLQALRDGETELVLKILAAETARGGEGPGTSEGGGSGASEGDGNSNSDSDSESNSARKQDRLPLEQIPDGYGNTPLHYIGFFGGADVAAVLLSDERTRSGVLAAKNTYGATALHCACESRRADVVAVVLAAGANPNVANMNGWTPLHNACRNPDRDVIRALLRHGASITAQTQTGDSPFDVLPGDPMLREATRALLEADVPTTGTAPVAIEEVTSDDGKHKTGERSFWERQIRDLSSALAAAHAGRRGHVSRETFVEIVAQLQAGEAPPSS
jgi:ankyrin repeat protein